MHSLKHVARWYARRLTGRCPSCGRPSVIRWRGSLCRDCSDYPEG